MKANFFQKIFEIFEVFLLVSKMSTYYFTFLGLGISGLFMYSEWLNHEDHASKFAEITP